MAKLLFLLILIAAVGVGVGLYRGWFQFSSDRSKENPTFSVTLDKEKIKEDKAQAEKRVEGMEHKVPEKVAPATQP